MCQRYSESLCFPAPHSNSSPRRRRSGPYPRKGSSNGDGARAAVDGVQTPGEPRNVFARVLHLPFDVSHPSPPRGAPHAHAISASRFETSVKRAPCPSEKSSNTTACGHRSTAGYGMNRAIRETQYVCFYGTLKASRIRKASRRDPQHPLARITAFSSLSPISSGR